MSSTTKKTLREKIRSVHRKQTNLYWRKRFGKETGEYITEILQLKNELPGELKRVKKFIDKVDQRLAELEIEGMLDGYIQFKDGDKMQLYTSQEKGERVRLYVGNDESKQSEAAKYLENFETHQRLGKEGADTVYIVREALRNLRVAARILKGLKLDGEK
jgi:hypothetical protein